eukprot:Polyplicarium_translucidae@DN3334_c0_g3_i3.p1
MEIRACFAFLFIWGVVAKGADYSGTGEYYHEKGSDYEHDKGSDYAKSYDHNSYDKGSDYAKSYDHYSDKGSDDSGSEVEKQLYFPKMSSAGDLKAVLTDASQVSKRLAGAHTRRHREQTLDSSRTSFLLSRSALSVSFQPEIVDWAWT